MIKDITFDEISIWDYFSFDDSTKWTEDIIFFDAEKGAL